MGYIIAIYYNPKTKNHQIKISPLNIIFIQTEDSTDFFFVLS